MPDADLDLAVEGALFSGFGTAGQRCTSLGTVIAHRDVHDEFLARFAAATERARIGDPLQDVLYGPMIDERFCDRFLGWLELLQPHHRVHGSTGTGRITAANPRRGFAGDPADGLYCHPTIVSGITADDELYKRETFGPIVGVAACDSLEEAVALANGHGYGLSAAVYTSDPAATAFRAGVVWPGWSASTTRPREPRPTCRSGQRPLRQRQPPVRHLGARPVHPLAGAELGLRRPPPEGPDGRGRADAGPGLSPVTEGPAGGVRGTPKGCPGRIRQISEGVPRSIGAPLQGLVVADLSRAGRSRPCCSATSGPT